MQSSESGGNNNLPAPAHDRGLTQWSPALDVYNEGGSTVIKAELPGVNKEDIDLSIDQGELVIRGERKSEERTEETNYVRMERSYGSFYRRLPLPKGVTEDDISATQADGVLEVRIRQPESERETTRRIPIK
jgi:HSP20 family protein